MSGKVEVMEGWAFTSGAGSLVSLSSVSPCAATLANLKEFAEAEGRPWTCPILQVRFMLRQSEVRRLLLELDRDRIVESMPWGD